uniref:RING-Gid-type domain-containing protein n=2 Tax=Lygus hesperus TaxID=30085 RepID=A0A0K8T0F9_LYGHE
MLMGMLLYLATGVSRSPYAHLVQPSLWADILETFTKDACTLLGLSVESPLSICINAGSIALPALLNIKQVMQQRQVSGIWNGKDELPIEIDVGDEKRFHSIFACPILKQQSTDTNPPMRLVCGHVISRDALNKLAQANKLKCPYCPQEQNPADARIIHF